MAGDEPVLPAGGTVEPASQLRQAGIEVEEHEASYPNRRFAELTDPDGTPIQLWEPAGADSV